MEARPEVSDELRMQVERLHAALTSSPDGSDLMITAFMASLKHFKRATIATPFPTDVFQDGRGEKDFEAALLAGEQLPSLDSLLKLNLGQSSNAAAIVTANIASLPPDSRKLLEWLVLPTVRRQKQWQQVSAAQFLEECKELQPGCKLPNLTGQNAPNYIFRHMSDMPPTKLGQPVIAYHGTAFERLHSIMNTGLLNMTGTKLQRTGANHGDGIYMSTDLGVSLAFCNPAIGWRSSALGHKLRCLLVCVVDKDLASEDRPPDEDAHSGEKLPPAYLLVSRTDAIRLQYIFIYQDEVKEVKTKRINWCTIIIVAYMVGIVMHHLFNMRGVQRWVRHQMRGY